MNIWVGNKSAETTSNALFERGSGTLTGVITRFTISWSTYGDVSAAFTGDLACMRVAMICFEALCEDTKDSYRI